MYLGSILENKAKEKRVAITPEMAKKYISLGVKLSLQRGFGTHLGFNDKDYSDLGVEILDNEKDVIKKVDVVVQLGLPDDEKLSLLKENWLDCGFSFLSDLEIFCSSNSVKL